MAEQLDDAAAQAVPAHWTLVRPSLKENTWLVAEKQGGWATLFLAEWKPALGVWHGRAPVLLDLCASDLSVLESVLQQPNESVLG